MEGTCLLCTNPATVLSCVVGQMLCDDCAARPADDLADDAAEELVEALAALEALRAAVRAHHDSEKKGRVVFETREARDRWVETGYRLVEEAGIVPREGGRG